MNSIIGAVLVICATSLAGFSLASQKKGELRTAEGFLRFVEHILIKLPSLLMMDSIFESFADEFLEKAGFIEILCAKNSNAPCNKKFLAAIEFLREDRHLHDILCRVGAELGVSDYRRQQDSLQAASGELKDLTQKRRETLAGSERSYKWIGFLTGALIAILLF